MDFIWALIMCNHFIILMWKIGWCLMLLIWYFLERSINIDIGYNCNAWYKLSIG